MTVGTESEPSGEAASHEILRGVVEHLLAELKAGAGDREKRRYVEEWLRSLAEKFPEFTIGDGLRAYYLAEAERLRKEFDAAGDLTEMLGIGRSIEMYLDKAADFARRDPRS